MFTSTLTETQYPGDAGAVCQLRLFGPGPRLHLLPEQSKVQTNKPDWLHTFKQKNAAPNLHFCSNINIVPSLSCLLPVSSSGLGLSFAVLSCLPTWPWLSSAPPWNTCACQTDGKIIDISRKKKKREVLKPGHHPWQPFKFWPSHWKNRWSWSHSNTYIFLTWCDE